MKELEDAHVREIRNLCDERIEEKAKLLRVQDETVIRSIKAEALDAGLIEKGNASLFSGRNVQPFSACASK